MPIGARVLKTGLAVCLSLFICKLLKLDPPLFAAAAAVLNLQPALGLSFINAREQLTIHFLSIGIAITIGLLLGGNPLTSGLAAIAVILICNRLKLRTGIASGVMAAIFILASPEELFINHAAVRSATILIGVGMALLINLTIARPNYMRPLRTKLLELNDQVSQSFSRAVQCFFSLDIPSAEELGNETQKTEKLFREAQKLHELFLADAGPLLAAQNEDDKGHRLFHEYLAYNRGLWQRTKDVYFLAEERRERRKKAGDHPVSPEFQEIITLLQNTLELFVRHNNELKEKVERGVVFSAEDPHIWRGLDEIINRWYDRFPAGSYYLHALIEISIVTYKIRWAAKESVRLLNL